MSERLRRATQVRLRKRAGSNPASRINYNIFDVFEFQTHQCVTLERKRKNFLFLLFCILCVLFLGSEGNTLRIFATRYLHAAATLFGNRGL